MVLIFSALLAVVLRATFQKYYSIRKMQEESNTSVKFSLRLLEIMKRRGLTQKDLSLLTNLSQGAVSKYLRGVSLPKSMELYRMSKVLGVTMEWLMGDDDLLADGGNDGYWQQEAIRLKTKLDMAISTLDGALKSLKSVK